MSQILKIFCNVIIQPDIRKCLVESLWQNHQGRLQLSGEETYSCTLTHTHMHTHTHAYTRYGTIKTTFIRCLPVVTHITLNKSLNFSTWVFLYDRGDT